MVDKKEVRKLLIHLERLRRSRLQPSFSEIGLTMGQGHARILEFLITRDHITQKELADSCHMDVTTMSRSLDRLEESGYLTRERDPSCRRSFLICLTEEGLAEAAKVRQILNSLDEQIWMGFTPDEMEVVCAGLRKICKNLEM